MPEPDICWDYRKLLADLGGPTGIRQALREAGIKAPSYQTILMWQRRDRVPSPWLATLVYLLQEVKQIPLSSVMREAVP
jgi:hypothetical protein